MKTMPSSNRVPAARRLVTVLSAAVLLLTCSGCNWFILLGYLIGGPPQIQPVFEQQTKKSLTDHNVKVVVVCYAEDDLRYQYDSIDHRIAARVASLLAHNKVDVVSPDLVRLWLEENQNWDSPEEVGSHFDATFVVYVDVGHFSLYEEDSSAALFRGRCEAIVSVYEMDAGRTSGSRIFSRDLTSVFPLQIPRSATEVSYETFSNEYFWRLGDEIGRMFYPYLNGDDIPHAT